MSAINFTPNYVFTKCNFAKNFIHSFKLQKVFFLPGNWSWVLKHKMLSKDNFCEIVVSWFVKKATSSVELHINWKTFSWTFLSSLFGSLKILAVAKSQIGFWSDNLASAAIPVMHVNPFLPMGHFLPQINYFS